MMGMLIVKKYSKFEVNTFDTDGVIDRKRKLNQQRRRRPGGDNSSAVRKVELKKRKKSYS